jgi:hypothetical protein
MKAQRSSPRGQATSRNANFALFAPIFFDIFAILYHSNRKHTNLQLNWTEGVPYRNTTIFSMKFKAPSWLRVRCPRSWIWASSQGQTWQEGIADQKERNRIARSTRKVNGANHGVRPLIEIQILHFLLVVFDIFSDSASLRLEAHQFSAQLDRRCGLYKFNNFLHKI